MIGASARPVLTPFACVIASSATSCTIPERICAPSPCLTPLVTVPSSKPAKIESASVASASKISASGDSETASVSRAASAGGSGSSNGKGGALDARRANSTARITTQIASTIRTAAIGRK